jgi:hypothetical protein
MKFRYVGEEYTEWFGFKWMTGTEHDVTDAHAIGKLSNSVLFEKADGDEPKKRGGRQPKPAAPEQEG